MAVPASVATAAAIITSPRTSSAAKALRRVGTGWFAIAALGQLLFAAYVLGFYGRLAWQGRPQDWDRVLPHGYVAGDTFFNAVLALHLLFGAARAPPGVCVELGFTVHDSRV